MYMVRATLMKVPLANISATKVRNNFEMCKYFREKNVRFIILYANE